MSRIAAALLAVACARLVHADASVPRRAAGGARDEAQAITPWPSVLPCRALTQLGAQADVAAELVWSGPRVSRRVPVDLISPNAPRRPLDEELVRDRPTRLRDPSPPLGRVWMTATCEGGRGAIEWRCGDSPSCVVEASYPRTGRAPSGTRGRDCPDLFHARAALTPVAHSRALLADALALIDRACAARRCGPAVARVAGLLRDAAAEPRWDVTVDSPSVAFLSSPRRRARLECYGDVAGNNRCMLEVGAVAFQQEESTSDCAFGRENLLMPDGDNFLSEDADGFSLSGSALRLAR